MKALRFLLLIGVIFAGSALTFAQCGGGVCPSYEPEPTVCGTGGCPSTDAPDCGPDGCPGATADSLDPFTAETHYMSIPGYLRWQAFVEGKGWFEVVGE